MAILIETDGQAAISDQLAGSVLGTKPTSGAVTDLAQRHRSVAFLTDALFCSELKIGCTPSEQELSAVIRSTLKAHRNWDECTRAVTAASCADLTSATRREVWCRQAAEQALGSDNTTSPLDCAE